MRKLIVVLGLLVFGFSLNWPVNAQDELPPASIQNDEGGAVVISGEMTYTNLLFTSGVDEPLILLEDQAGFVDRNEYFLFPLESQTLGQITSDFYTSPVSYSLALPIEPQGSLRDVDQDGASDTGVMGFAVAYWDNTWGDPFLEERDMYGGGWSTGYASTRIGDDPVRPREVIGGKYVIYAPDDQQGFPAGFGADDLLFTADDPIVRVPQGYTVVNLDTDPFTFDRARRQTIDLIEPEEAALVDYSSLGYTEAFDALVTLLRTRYAFTEYKQIDWDALAAKYRPEIEMAETSSDTALYFSAISSFLWSVPDGHVNVSPLDNFVQQFFTQYGNGLGLVVRETADQRAYVTTVIDGEPGDNAGIQTGAEILAVNGRPIAEHIARLVPWGETYSTTHARRIAQAYFALRFPQVTTTVDITYQNPNDTQPTTRTLSTSAEVESFLDAISGTPSDAYALPVDYRVLEDGLVYVQILSFVEDRALTIDLWERLMRSLNGQAAPGLIIDLRFNGGGSGFLADQMTAYFFNEPLILGTRGSYNEALGDFFFDARSEQRMYLPAEDLRYNGPVAVLVSPSCASACERFAYNMTLQNRAAIIGHYPTAGLGGSVTDMRLPEGLTVRYTTGRSLDKSGNIHIEGIGIIPTLTVPLTRDVLFDSGDPLLEAAAEYLR